MNTSEDPNDRLLDSLLREQARETADNELLQAIDARLDAVKSPARRRKRGSKSFLWLTAAAALVMASVGVMMWQVGHTSGSPVLAMEPSPPRSIPSHDPAVEAHKKMADRSLQVSGGSASNRAEFHLPEVAPAPPAMPVGNAIPQDLAGLDVEPAPAAEVGAAGGAGGGRKIGTGSGSGTGRGIGTEAGMDFSRPPRQRVLPPSPSSASRTGDTSSDLATADFYSGFVLPGEAPPATHMPGKAKAGEGSLSRENYGRLIDQPWKSPWQDALSTFSIDVDTASYTNVRRMISEGRKVPADAVRIEELVNYFDYGYAGPQGDGPFAVHGTLATCPWKPQHLLARVAIKGREIEAKARPASNLVFLIDVSGSMQDPDKLPLLKRSMRVLLDQLDERDRLGIVVYAGSEGVALPPTTLDERGLSAAIRALEKLEAGGSTNGGAGIKRAYEMAAKHLVPGGVNRVILATDGDFNVGTTGQGELVSLVKKGAAQGVSLSVLGFGAGNLNDAMLEAITNDGDGNYFYIDGDHEARRVFLQKLTGTLVTIAKDVKIQVEFNPGKVQAYRLIGYANRILRHEDFNNDKVDAGDIGAGHTVTAFYEIVPPGVAMPDAGSVDALRYQKPADQEAVPSDDWFTLKLRHKHPEGEVSSLIETPVKGEPLAWEQAGNDFRFASSVALFGMKLREMPDAADVSWHRVVEIAGAARAGGNEQRAEFVEMVARHGRFPLPPVAAKEEADPLDGISYLRDDSTMWYVQFGLESQGKWAPRFVGLTPDRKKLQNRVSAVEILSPGDEFFKEGEFAGRFKFLDIEVREITSERTGLTQMVKVAIYEDLKPGKKGKRYESQAGLPDAELGNKAYYDRTAVLKIGEREVRVEEWTRFADASGKECFLKSVSPERIEIEFKSPTGETVTREIRK